MLPVRKPEDPELRFRVHQPEAGNMLAGMRLPPPQAARPCPWTASRVRPPTPRLRPCLLPVSAPPARRAVLAVQSGRLPKGSRATSRTARYPPKSGNAPAARRPRRPALARALPALDHLRPRLTGAGRDPGQHDRTPAGSPAASRPGRRGKGPCSGPGQPGLDIAGCRSPEALCAPAKVSAGLLSRALKPHRFRAATFHSSRIRP